MNKNYMCFFCGKQHVKLWRPKKGDTPLICAECAEKVQSPIMYNEYIWQELENDCFFGKPTGKELPLPKWEVNENGEVPSYRGPRPLESALSMTTSLSIDLPDTSTSYTLKNTIMVPAYLNEYGSSEEELNLWVNLPTR